MITGFMCWVVDTWHCIYNCGFSGTYDEVQSHQSSCPNKSY